MQNIILTQYRTTNTRNKDVRNGCVSGLRALGVRSAKGLWGVTFRGLSSNRGQRS